MKNDKDELVKENNGHNDKAENNELQSLNKEREEVALLLKELER